MAATEGHRLYLAARTDAELYALLNQNEMAQRTARGKDLDRLEADREPMLDELRERMANR